MPNRPIDEEDGSTPITSNALIKWGGAAGAVGLALIGCIWKFASLESAQALAARDAATNATRIAEVNALSAERDARQELEITELKTGRDALRAQVTEISNKLTEIGTIVRRIDERVPGKP